jgi:hypothetical protein
MEVRMIGNIQWHIAKNSAIVSILNSSAHSIRIYRDTMPTDANAYVKGSYASSLLCTWAISTNAYTQTNVVGTGNGSSKTYLSKFPYSASAANSGTALWFVIDLTGSQIVGNNPFLIDTVSDIGGTGVLRLTTTLISSGSICDIASLAFSFGH